MMQEMQQALAAVSEQIKTVPSKIPEGKTVVAVELDRDPAVSGRFMTAISSGWQPTGKAIALQNGHVLAANYLFGRFSAGTPKVTACHYVRCSKCGKRTLMPLAVWEAKDCARAAGEKKDLDRGIGGYELLRRYGHCSCGGKWTDDAANEKRDLAEFAQRVLKAIEEAPTPEGGNGQIPPFLAPRAFLVRQVEEAVDLGTEWDWLKETMARNNKAAIPFTKDGSGQVLVFNPGFWLGWVDDHDKTDLFFLEKGKDRLGRGRLPAADFNPSEVNGL